MRTDVFISHVFSDASRRTVQRNRPTCEDVMGFGRTEVCMLAVIFVCLSYLYLDSASNDENFTKSRAASEDATSLDEESTVHSVRMACSKSTGAPANMLLLDLTHPTPAGELGDTILENLFNVSEALLIIEEL